MASEEGEVYSAISAIRDEGGEVRKRSDQILKHIIGRVATDLGLC